MTEESISQESRWKKFLKSISLKKYTSAVTGRISISAFASLLDIPIKIMSSVIELKTGATSLGV